MSVEANLRDLIQHKRNLVEQLNADIQLLTARRDSIINLVVELESLLPQDDHDDEEFRLGGSEGPVIPWSDSSASIRKGRPIMDRPQA